MKLAKRVGNAYKTNGFGRLKMTKYLKCLKIFENVEKVPILKKGAKWVKKSSKTIGFLSKNAKVQKRISKFQNLKIRPNAVEIFQIFKMFKIFEMFKR